MKKVIFLLFVLAIISGCTKNTFVIKFVDWDDNLIEEFTLTENQKINAPEAPEREGCVFVGWDQEFDKARGNMTIKAVYEEKEFTVTFIGVDGEVVKEEKVKYGRDAIAPTLPYPNGYYRWDKEFKKIKEDLTVRALTEYTIKYFDGNTELFFDVEKYEKGDVVELPIPNKEGYEFIGWFLSDRSLYEIEKIDQDFYGDLKLYSRWIKTEVDTLNAPEGAVEFKNILKKPHSSGNGYVYQPEFPAGARSTSVTEYTWTSSNTKVATISMWSSISVVSPGYAIIKATLNSDPNYVLYCVIKTSVDGVTKATLEEANAPNYVYATFNLDDGTSVKKMVTKGGHVIPPTPTPKEGYVFVGWEGENGEDIYNISKDTTYNAKYIKGSKSYAGKTISVLGDSISTYQGYLPEGFASFYPYATADLNDVYQTWWMQFINHYGMKLLSNNSWGGSAVAGNANSAAQKVARLQHLIEGYTVPDVILIFMGANDAASPYIDVQLFDAAYEKMIENIKLLAPNAEIIVCTLPSLPLYSENDQIEYNEVIRKHASNNGCTIIEFEQVFTRSEISNYLVDSAHPDFAGMKKLAEQAINTLKELIKS